MDLSQFKPINVPDMRQTTPIQQIPPQPEVVMGDIPAGGLFSHLVSQENPIAISSGTAVSAETTKKRGRKKKTEEVEVLDADGKVISGSNARDDIADLSNMNFEETYRETSAMIRGTIMQLDTLGSELKSDLDQVRANRTLRNKYTYITNISESLSSVLSTKLNAIKELNSSVKNINDMNYRKAKDMRAMEAGNDDKYIMDMYNAFVSNPVGTSVPIGVTTSDITLGNNVQGVDVGASVPIGSGVTATVDGSPIMPQSNIRFTPEQNMMLYEGNPNVQMCVVYDKATGNKWFQVYDISTKTPIENTPVKDPMFLQDTTIDERHGIAKNTNINETYPLILLNADKFSDF